jgi:hypothetical protein
MSSHRQRRSNIWLSTTTGSVAASVLASSRMYAAPGIVCSVTSVRSTASRPRNGVVVPRPWLGKLRPLILTSFRSPCLTRRSTSRANLLDSSRSYLLVLTLPLLLPLLSKSRVVTQPCLSLLQVYRSWLCYSSSRSFNPCVRGRKQVTQPYGTLPRSIPS